MDGRVARCGDRKRYERREILNLLSSDPFIEALKTNLTGGWLLRFPALHPKALAEAAGIL
jgi:hypothetical protein